MLCATAEASSVDTGIYTSESWTLHPGASNHLANIQIIKISVYNSECNKILKFLNIYIKTQQGHWRSNVRPWHNHQILFFYRICCPNITLQCIDNPFSATTSRAEAVCAHARTNSILKNWWNHTTINLCLKTQWQERGNRKEQEENQPIAQTACSSKHGTAGDCTWRFSELFQKTVRKHWQNCLWRSVTAYYLFLSLGWMRTYRVKDADLLQPLQTDKQDWKYYFLFAYFPT